MEELRTPLTAAELIEYLQMFPPGSKVSLYVIDTHKERKMMFGKTDEVLVTDADRPVMFINIDVDDRSDITAEVDETSTEEE